MNTAHPAPSGTPTPTTFVYDSAGQLYEADLVDGFRYRTLETELTALRAEWNAREPQLYKAERDLEAAQTCIAQKEKERDDALVITRTSLVNLHDVIRERDKRIAALEAQLPDGMKDCTIQFKECSKGHDFAERNDLVSAIRAALAQETKL